MDNKKKEITEEEALNELKKGENKAKELLDKPDKLEDTLQRLEKKFKQIPAVGTTLSNVPLLISLVRSYVKKEYTDIPYKSVVSIVSALVYVLSPIDLFPDGIPGIGLIDDATVVLICMKFVEIDVDRYKEWRKKNNKEIDA